MSAVRGDSEAFFVLFCRRRQLLSVRGLRFHYGWIECSALCRAKRYCSTSYGEMERMLCIDLCDLKLRGNQATPQYQAVL